MAKKRKINYPTGVKPIMRNHKRIRPKKTKAQKKASRARAIRRMYSGNKYNAHGSTIYVHGHKIHFDSKAERRFYNYLNIIHANFMVHPRFVIIPHVKTKDLATGKIFKIRKHNYTPDFVIFKKGVKIDRKKLEAHPQKYVKYIKEVIDIKGGRASPYANLRFDLFALKYHIPVTVIKFRYKRVIKKTRGEAKK